MQPDILFHNFYEFKIQNKSINHIIIIHFMKKNYSTILFLQQELEKRMESFILSALKENGRSISFTPDDDEEMDFHKRFPAFDMFCQQSTEEEIGFTRVYLNESNYIMAEGIERMENEKRKGLFISTPNYSSVCHFIAYVLQLYIYDFTKEELVYWQDPDNKASSGFYRISDFDKQSNDEIIQAEKDRDNRVFSITNGVSTADVYGKELIPVSDEIIHLISSGQPQVIATSIIGQQAANYYFENDKVPPYEWLIKNSGDVHKHRFSSLNELLAYEQGLKDMAGNEDYALLNDISDRMLDCSHCEAWRVEFKDNVHGAYCPACGNNIVKGNAI